MFSLLLRQSKKRDTKQRPRQLSVVGGASDTPAFRVLEERSGWGCSKVKAALT